MSAYFAKHLEVGKLMYRLRQTLDELWRNEYEWLSTEVFSPIYEIICAMMALHGLVFVKAETEWRMVMCEDESQRGHLI